MLLDMACHFSTCCANGLTCVDHDLCCVASLQKESRASKALALKEETRVLLCTRSAARLELRLFYADGAEMSHFLGIPHVSSHLYHYEQVVGDIEPTLKGGTMVPSRQWQHLRIGWSPNNPLNVLILLPEWNTLGQ